MQADHIFSSKVKPLSKNPNRCSGNIRNWDRINKVYLNPEKAESIG